MWRLYHWKKTTLSNLLQKRMYACCIWKSDVEKFETALIIPKATYGENKNNNNAALT